MNAILAYIGVVLIWATTPLGIHWSNSSLSFVAAAALRMSLALTVCLMVLLVTRQPLVRQRSEWKMFAVGSIGLFPNMLVVYWSAQYIPSGLMAVVLGVTPFFVGVFSRLILKEGVLNLRRVAALLIAVAGLALIHAEQLAVGPSAALGVGGMVVSAMLFALSSVWLTSMGGGVDPFRQGTGILLCATPSFVVVWYLLDGALPADVDIYSVSGVAYLVLAGSVLGNTLYFYVLRHYPVDRVSLITLMTPVLALGVGRLVQGEEVTWQSGLGAGLVVSALAVYLGVARRGLRRVWRLLTHRSRKPEQTTAILSKARSG